MPMESVSEAGGRGRPYPIVRLASALPKLENAFSNGQRYASESELVRALGFRGPNSNAKRFKATCLMLGLIQRSADRYFEISELGIECLKRESAALKRALMHSTLYKQIFPRFRTTGKLSIDALVPILVDDLGIAKTSGKKAAAVFLQSCTDAEMASPDGTLLVHEEGDDLSPDTSVVTTLKRRVFTKILASFDPAGVKFRSAPTEDPEEFVRAQIESAFELLDSPQCPPDFELKLVANTEFFRLGAGDLMIDRDWVTRQALKRWRAHSNLEGDRSAT